MDREAAEKIIRENYNGHILMAVKVILADDLEGYKKALLRAEDPEARGKGQYCAKLHDYLVQPVLDPEDFVDN